MTRLVEAGRLKKCSVEATKLLQCRGTNYTRWRLRRVHGVTAAPSASDGDGDDGRQRPDGRRVVFLHPHQAPQDVVAVPWPRVHVRVLQPGGNVTLEGKRRKDVLSFLWPSVIIKSYQIIKQKLNHRCGGGSASTLRKMISKIKHFWF